MFHSSIWGLGALFGGLSTPKPHDGTELYVGRFETTYTCKRAFLSMN